MGGVLELGQIVPWVTAVALVLGLRVRLLRRRWRLAALVGLVAGERTDAGPGGGARLIRRRGDRDDRILPPHALQLAPAAEEIVKAHAGHPDPPQKRLDVRHVVAHRVDADGQNLDTVADTARHARDRLRLGRADVVAAREQEGEHGDRPARVALGIRSAQTLKWEREAERWPSLEVAVARWGSRRQALQSAGLPTHPPLELGCRSGRRW